MHTVFEVENLEPLESAQFCSLFKHHCKCLSMIWISITDKKVIDIKRTFDTRAQCFNY